MEEGAKGGGGDTPKTPLHLNEKGSRDGHTETQTHTHRDTHTQDTNTRTHARLKRPMLETETHNVHHATEFSKVSFQMS